ncbi:MAG: Stk1 family PASTA domain-containing Ser/Thr kinase [Firmicutes bacterium]|nr:Stk1 family PASTA domain-containing Ser/Thr kinase [Bacillota bacterium]
MSNRYEIDKRIGEGGMAIVYKAKDRLLHRWVAVKVLREHYASDVEFVERFRREAQAAASLSHPNVVNIYDVGEIANTHFIVMEYVRGINLKELIRKRGKLTPSRAVDIGLQVVAALGHAHRNGLVHRDIKPHNILITEDGQVKVTDFGIARAASSATLTQTGLVIGSVHYFSPEQARGGLTTEQSDIYSLGIVLYEMLTGQVPFTGETPIAVALQQLQDPVPSPRKLDPSIPKLLENVLYRALAKEPRSRFPSADSFMMALKKTGLAAEDPIYLHEEPSGAPTQKWDAVTRKVPAADAEEATRIHGLERGESVSDKKRKTTSKRKRTRIFLVLFGVAFLGGLIWGISYLPQLIFPAEVNVPDITGLTVMEARTALDKERLKLAVDKEVPDADIPAGQVIRQDPAARRRVKEGRTVWVVVSTGPRLKQVPDVEGLHVDEAKELIKKAELSVGMETPVFEPSVLVDYVVSQSPKPGTFLEEGLAVDLMVSQDNMDRPLVILPDLRGESLEEAKARVRRLGLGIGNVWGEVHRLLPAWEVTAQRPGPGTKVPQGSAVDFVYNSWGTGQPAESPPEDIFEEMVEDETVVDVYEDEPVDGSQDMREAGVQITIPPGPEQEVVIIVIDKLGAREVYRGKHAGDTTITRHVRGYGKDARIQVYIDNFKASEKEFPSDT